jgi:hypothetical protein
MALIRILVSITPVQGFDRNQIRFRVSGYGIFLCEISQRQSLFFDQTGRFSRQRLS